MSTFSEKRVKAVRKKHYCCGCEKVIDIGQPAINWAGIAGDGDFQIAYYHPECRAAEIELNHIHGTHGDEWQNLTCLEVDDLDWLKDEHPAVWARVVPS